MNGVEGSVTEEPEMTDRNDTSPAHAITRRRFSALVTAAAAFGSSAVAAAQTASRSEAGPNENALGSEGQLRVAILLFPGTTVLDWVGPYEALHRVPGVELLLVARSLDLMTADSGVMQYKANLTLDEVTSADVLFVPGGGPGVRDASNDPVLMDWVRRIDATTRYTTSTCTGSLILARAGLLSGRQATTHWALKTMLANEGARYVPERWVVSDKYWTAAGVSAGIDMTLALIADIYGDDLAMMTQLRIEYDPHPPFDAGSERTAPSHVLSAVREASARSQRQSAPSAPAHHPK